MRAFLLGFVVASSRARWRPGKVQRRSLSERPDAIFSLSGSICVQYIRTVGQASASRATRPTSGRAPILVGSKLRVPRPRTDAIDRPAVVQRLHQHYGLVTVVAPPGFGKTTSLGAWARMDDRPFAWLSLDREDNDPVVLWNGIQAAFRQAGLDRIAPAGILQTGGDLMAGPIPRFLNAIQEDGTPFVLVLDDFHRITNPPCHASIEFLLEHTPPNLTTVVSSRTRPALPIGRIRASGALLELEAADLAFTRAEIGRLMNDRLGLRLNERSLDILNTRTEGWAAGLYLAYLSVRDVADPDASIEAFGGSDRRVADYLSEVVLESLDEPIRGFMLSTSILERLTGPLCDAVTGRSDSARILIELERMNRFLIPLDDRRTWYRYHRLFAELLNDALRRYGPRAPTELHRRAYRWFANAGDHEAAILHAIRAGDLEEATLLVCQHYLAAFEWGGSSTVARWIESFPREWVTRDARLSIVEAWAMSFLGRRADAESAIANAASLDYEGPLPDGAASMEASIALLRAGFPWDDVGEMLTAARRAYRLEARTDSMWAVTVHVQLGWALCLSGDFQRARGYLERGAARAPTTQQWLNAFGARCCLAWVEMESDDLRAAERHAREALAVAETHHFDDSPPGGWGATMLGAILARAGRAREADELLARGIELLREGGQPLVRIQANLERAVVLHSLGARADARALVSEALDMLGRFRDPGILSERAATVARLVSRTPSSAGTSELTTRELDVLRLLAKDLSKRQSAQALYVSFNTIHSHIRSIYRKLGASSRREAVARAQERGLL